MQHEWAAQLGGLSRANGEPCKQVVKGHPPTDLGPGRRDRCGPGFVVCPVALGMPGHTVGGCFASLHVVCFDCCRPRAWVIPSVAFRHAT